MTDKLVVRKLKTLSGYKKAYRATATVEGHIQNLDEESTEKIGGVYGQTYVGWLPEDVEFTPAPDDQITDDDGRLFLVKTAEKLDFGVNNHWELILERFNPKDRE